MRLSICMITLLFFSIFSISHAEQLKHDPEVTNYVHLDQYLGTWYEVARFKDHPFQNDCLSSKAEYSIDGKFIAVKNSCKTLSGEIKVAHALAKVKDKETNAKLKVSFVPFFNRFGLFAGDYWILDTKEDSYSLVGAPNRKFLWILSRTPVLDEAIMNDLKAKAKEQGYDLENLIETKTWE